MRIIDPQILLASRKPYSLAKFEKACTQSIEIYKQHLQDVYYKDIIDVFLKGSKMKQLPNPALVNKLRRFYNSVGTLMTYHMQMICLASLEDYTQYVIDKVGLILGIFLFTH